MHSQPNFTTTMARHGLIFKLAFIGILILVLLIPMSMIYGLINERKSSRSEAVYDILANWGGEQTVGGPVISIPCQVTDRHKTKVVWTHFLPETLFYEGLVDPKILNRGIFRTPVYQAKIAMKGVFNKPAVEALVPEAVTILWDKAVISLGISDPRAIRNVGKMDWNGKTLQFGPGNGSLEFLGSHIQAPLPNLQNLASDSPINWSLDLNLAGGKRLYFLPLGKETKANMSSTWLEPGFSGAYLPEHREINDEGFKSSWSVLHLGRNHPQEWRSDALPHIYLSDNAFGVDLLLPVDIYTMSTRSVKYAVLFIFLTFTAFFLFETLNRLRIHPIQYLMVGMALCIFYLLLLSLSEYLPFSLAYFLASSGVTCIITAYSASVLKKRRRAGVMVVLLGCVYGFLFVLLQLSELSLLLGSLGLFVIMALVMALTRNIDWYAPGPKQEAAQPKGT